MGIFDIPINVLWYHNANDNANGPNLPIGSIFHIQISWKTKQKISTLQTLFHILTYIKTSFVPLVYALKT